jgi:nicotinamidase-related amidase
VFVNVEGAGATDFLPERGQNEFDHVVTKSQPSAFHDVTGLAEHLTELGVKEVVVVGVATSRGVESTVRDAHQRGFRVTVARDALTDRTQEAHDKSLDQVLRRLGRDATVAEIIAALPAT